jgi:hypothetical protein
MARLSFYPVRLAGKTGATPTGWASLSVRTPTATSPTIWGAIGIPDIRIHRLTITRADVMGWQVEFFTVVLLPGEETKLSGRLPIGWELFEMFDEDSSRRETNPDDTCRWAVRADPIHLANEIERLHEEEWADYYCPQDRRPMTHSERANMGYRLDAAFKVNKQYELLRVVFDMRDLDDLCAEINSDVAYYVESHVRHFEGIRIDDSSMPKLESRPIHRHGQRRIALVVKSWMEATPSEIVVPSIDDNFKSRMVGWCRDVLQLNRAGSRMKVPESGRRLNLFDEPVEFPAATRCKMHDIEWLAFGLDARCGYHPVDGQRQTEWVGKDYMLIHRGEDCWRFLFVVYGSVTIKVAQTVEMGVIIPYLVEDRECSIAPRNISPQRGMPLAITKAINETPYCAAAISHGIARLKYLKSQIGFLNGSDEPVFHHPKLPMLFRAKHGPRVVGSSRGGSASQKAGDAAMVFGACRALLRDAPEHVKTNALPFGLPVSETSVLGDLVHRPRMVLLDM